LPNSYRDSALVVFALLLAFRIVNALTLRTFFQPDEFFQSLEPAWQLAFGDTSNAWITWVNALP
jgi:phosphatidylinositol glycan class B